MVETRSKCLKPCFLESIYDIFRTMSVCSKKFYFDFQSYHLGISVSSEDVNPDFAQQSNEINEVLCVVLWKMLRCKKWLKNHH